MAAASRYANQNSKPTSNNERTPTETMAAVHDDTSDSEAETEPAKSFHRRISTNKEIKFTRCIKEGYLIKHSSSSFHRSRRRYFKLKGRKLYYGKDTKSEIFDEIILIDCSIAECSTKNCNLNFQVITPFRNLVLCAETRQDMDEWIAALKSAAKREFYEAKSDHQEMLNGYHNWYACSHARPTYCNVCREALSGVTSHGLSCEVCKFKVHKRCAVRAANNCKWTTLASVGKQIIEEEDGMISMPHQWLEGNLPVSAKCVQCDRTCGSVLRLEDLRCLWCKVTIHTSCKEAYSRKCSMGQCHISILPPVAITTLDSNGYWRAKKLAGTSPLLVFVNSKSGDTQGIKMLRKFKQLVNPTQVFDLINGGPRVGLRLFQNFESFRVIVSGGDGSIGWVLNEIDRMGLHNECQVGVLPLGTGNDLARVLGWGAAFDDETQLLNVLDKMEHAQIKMLDRWSVMTYEGLVPPPRKLTQQINAIAAYEDSVATHLSKILHSDSHNVVISSAKVLCETIKDFMAKVARSCSQPTTYDDHITRKCSVLNDKLDALLVALEEESSPESSTSPDGACGTSMSCSGMACGGSTALAEAVADALSAVHRASPIASPQMSESKDSKDCMDKKNARRQSHAMSSWSGASVSTSADNIRPSNLSKKPRQRKPGIQRPRDQLMSRANSLKKAVRQIIEHAEKVVDEQNSETLRYDEELAEREKNLDNCRVDEQTKSEKVASLPPNPIIEIVAAAADGEDESEVMRITADDSVSPVSPSGGLHGESLAVPAFNWDAPTAALSPIPEPSYLTDFFLRLPSPLSPTTPTSPNMSSSSSHFGLYPPSCPPTPGSVRSEMMLASNSPNPTRRISTVSILHNKNLTENSRHERSPAKETPRFPILGSASLPVATGGASSSLASSSLGANFISKVLLANADALCAAVSPLMTDEIPLEDYQERGVMNNYFGIGLDAKITLDFHTKREEHPEKCRSRTKNMMWYGMIGSRQLMQRTYRNLEQRVQLECDGQRIPLPNLQGIVVLNIPSYMGGINFWGNSKSEDNFTTTSFDDKILEVVAVFGGVQLGISRVINLQSHRIAQCRSVKITIMGEEGVPVQVDGEAWMHPPGYICIVHKNRAQMLIRDKVFEEALKTWTEKQKIERANCKSDTLSEEETQILQSFVQATHSFITSVKFASLSHSSVEQDLSYLATQASSFLDRLYPAEKLTEAAMRSKVSDLVSSVRTLYNETNLLMTDKIKAAALSDNVADRLMLSLTSMATEMTKVYEIGGLPHFQDIQQEACDLQQKKHKEKSHFSLMRLKRGAKKEKDKYTGPNISAIHDWDTDEVGQWLESLGLSEYQDGFLSHDIRGEELLNLGRHDLKDLGVSKVGHLKRIQQGIKDIKAKLAYLKKHPNAM